MSESYANLGPHAIVPVQLGETTTYVWARQIDLDTGEEYEIGGRPPRIDDALESVRDIGERVMSVLRTLQTSRLTVELEFELAVESGALVALLGKASGRTAFKVGLEWTRTPED